MMAEPVTTETTDSIYSRLPEVYRIEDANFDYALKHYISAVGDQAGDVEALYDRFETGGLVDPATAEPEWLPYIAQLTGVQGISSVSESEARTLLADVAAGRGGGTAKAIIAAAKTIVGGSGQVGLYKFTTDVSPIGGATQWDMLLVTRVGEAQGDVVQRVIELGAKPAGVILYHREWQVTWEDIHATYPTWTQINALPNWEALEQTGI